MDSMITLAHGAGGKATQELLENVILPLFKLKNYNAVGSDALDDGSAIRIGKEYMVFTSDSYVVRPIFFKGGDIGKLAICGAVNDLAALGAKPIALHLNLIIEEGFEENDLRKIMRSANSICESERICLLGGDIKVMEKGKIDKIVISTFGIGKAKKLILDSGLKENDRIIITGSIGDHETAILSDKQNLNFDVDVQSDCAPLYTLIKNAIKTGEIHAMKDITRGGLSTALNEFAVKSNIGIEVYEKEIPIKEGTKKCCEVFGFDPFSFACEGRMVIGVKENDAAHVLKILRKNKLGKEAKIIGRAIRKNRKMVILHTLTGGKKLLHPPVMASLPRIC